MKVLTVFIFFILLGNISFAQFVICNSGTTNALKDIQFINENVGIAVGESGTIIRSIDGGLNWSPTMLDSELDFIKVDFFDEQHAIAISKGYTIGAGAIFISDDGGQSWSESDFENANYFDIAILSDGTCVISGSPNAIIRSNDFGNSWDVLMEDSDPGNWNFGLLSFIDDSIGYCWPYNDGSGNTTRKTTDGGETWTVIEATTEPGNTVIECMSFVSEEIGFQGGWYLSHMKRTTDGGDEWETLAESSEESTWEMLDFHITQEHPNSYYASGWYGDIKKSIDGGDTWFEIISGVDYRLYGIFFITEEIGWAVGYDGVIIKTESGGEPNIILEFEDKNNLTIYPNPTKDTIYIDNPENINISMITIINEIGQVVMVSDYENNISVVDLAKGNYIIGLVMDEGTTRHSFVKE